MCQAILRINSRNIDIKHEGGGGGADTNFIPTAIELINQLFHFVLLHDSLNMNIQMSVWGNVESFKLILRVYDT